MYPYIIFLSKSFPLRHIIVKDKSVMRNAMGNTLILLDMCFIGYVKYFMSVLCTELVALTHKILILIFLLCFGQKPGF